MIRKLAHELIDEIMGTILLHGFMRYGDRPPLVGPTLADVPHLHSGQPRLFYSPRPEPVDLWARSVPVGAPALGISDFQFPSPIFTAHPENNLVWGRRWQPHASDGGLTVLGVDGIVQLGCRWFDRLASRLNPVGIEVVTMDSPYNFRRTPKGYRPGQLIMGGDLNHQLAVARQAVLDLWTVIRSLKQAGRRVGLVGASYGGWLVLMTALIAAEIDANIDFVIAVTPPVDMVQLLDEGGTIMRAVRRGLGYNRFDLEQVKQVAAAMVPSRWDLPLPGTAVTLHAARYDRFVPPHRIEALAEKWQARLVMHNTAHYGLAVSATISEIIAEDISRLDRSRI